MAFFGVVGGTAAVSSQYFNKQHKSNCYTKSHSCNSFIGRVPTLVLKSGTCSPPLWWINSYPKGWGRGGIFVVCTLWNYPSNAIINYLNDLRHFFLADRGLNTIKKQIVSISYFLSRHCIELFLFNESIINITKKPR